jgi:hypothetical protein
MTVALVVAFLCLILTNHLWLALGSLAVHRPRTAGPTTEPRDPPAAVAAAFTLGTHVGAAGVATLLRAQAHRGATLHARYCAVDLPDDETD